MKRRNIMMSVATTYIVSCFLLSGCNGQKQIDSSTIEYINLKEDVHLEDNTTSPACKMTIDYAYLAEKMAMTPLHIKLITLSSPLF